MQLVRVRYCRCCTRTYPEGEPAQRHVCIAAEECARRSARRSARRVTVPATMPLATTAAFEHQHRHRPEYRNRHRNEHQLCLRSSRSGSATRAVWTRAGAARCVRPLPRTGPPRALSEAAPNGSCALLDAQETVRQCFCTCTLVQYVMCRN